MGREPWMQMLASSWDAYPLEACGLLIGHPMGSQVLRFEPITNAAASARIYELDGAEYAKAAMRADRDDLDIIGVMHSHTRTAAYPSPTDVAQASKPLIPPTWHWVIVTLAWGEPELRSFRIIEGGIAEEPVELTH
ncbi:MAG: M67 family metallopeptidase [Actinomycetota bacterium]